MKLINQFKVTFINHKYMEADFQTHTLKNPLINNSEKISLSCLTFIQGNEFDLEENNYYVLEFWATWCRPCIKCIPHLKNIYNKYKNFINFVSITHDNNNKKIIDFVTSKKDIMTYPVANDINNIIHEKLEINSIPQLFIIDGNGNILLKSHPLDNNVIQYLDKIMNEKNNNEVK